MVFLLPVTAVRYVREEESCAKASFWLPGDRPAETSPLLQDVTRLDALHLNLILYLCLIPIPNLFRILILIQIPFLILVLSLITPDDNIS